MSINKSNIQYMVGIGVVILLLIIYILNKVELEKCKEELTFLEEYKQPSNDAVLQQILIHNISLSSRVYQSFVTNKDYWNKEINHPTLIYRYPEHMCRGCYHENMEALLKLQEEIGKDKILLLPTYEESRENKIKLRNELGKYNYKNTPFNFLVMPEHNHEKAYQQFFAIIDKNKEISMVFFPQLGHKDLTKLYFDKVKEALGF